MVLYCPYSPPPSPQRNNQTGWTLSECVLAVQIGPWAYLKLVLEVLMEVAGAAAAVTLDKDIGLH